MKVNVNGNFYDIPDKQMVNNILNIAKDAVKNKNAIYALEFPGYLEMKNIEFKTKEGLIKLVDEYKKENIIVHYNLKPDKNKTK